MKDKNQKIVVTGAAGLVGQNLILLLREQGYHNIVALDKHKDNLQILASLNPDISIIHVDLATVGEWQEALQNAAVVLMLHAQITGTDPQEFVRNNDEATGHVLAAMKRYQIPQLVHISSSVVNSVADDDYTRTKKSQEAIVLAAAPPITCVLRPTLMFGWFDPKHLGWLSRFMAKVPVFPIPGHGRYLRQPLYSRDFCRVIIAAMEQNKTGIYDIVGQEEITYIDIIRLIKKLKKLHTWILPIPYRLFYWLLKVYALFSNKPPFTADQLTALTAGDHFSGVDMQKTFGVQPTALQTAFRETFTDVKYSHIEVQRS